MMATILAIPLGRTMNKRDPLQVNLSDLVVALEMNHSECYYLLDLRTGEVVLAGSEQITGEPEDEDWDDPDLFLPIRTIDSHESFRFMEDFAYELGEGPAQRALFDALAHRKPFRSFKDALEGFPRIRERWFAYHEDRLKEYARHWLAAYAPGAELVQD